MPDTNTKNGLHADMQRVVDLAHELIALCDSLGDNQRLTLLSNAVERLCVEIERELAVAAKAALTREMTVAAKAVKAKSHP